MSSFALEQVLLAGFHTSVEADKRTEQLRSNLGFQAKNRVARLAIGRSLAEAHHPDDNIEGSGKPIKGDVLFGLDELPLWIGLLVTHFRKAQPQEDITLATIQELVRRHWHRGCGYSSRTGKRQTRTTKSLLIFWSAGGQICQRSGLLKRPC